LLLFLFFNTFVYLTHAYHYPSMTASQPKPGKLRFVLLALAGQLAPAALAVYISFYLVQFTSFRFEYAFPLILVWGIIGAVIHYASLKRGMKFRLTTMAIFAAVTMGVAVGLTFAFAIDHSKLKTCPVCGFVALTAVEENCPVCHVTFRGMDAKVEGFESETEYLIAAQTMHFMPVAPDTAINFFAPCNCNGNYAKDPAWQPSVSKQDILEVQALTKGK
jgi:hypothetical protein